MSGRRLLPQPSNEASQEPDATPQADATASPEEAPLGGGLILVYEPRDTIGPCEGSVSDLPVRALQLGCRRTGQQTLLGTAADLLALGMTSSCSGHLIVSTSS